MNRRHLASLARTYHNNGQHAEQVYAYAITGEIRKASNLRHEVAGDVGNVQVKSARATVCTGTDLNAYLAKDSATVYAYITKDFRTAYEMNRKEWTDFVNAFGTVTRDSAKNGGTQKIRLRYETDEMLAWLDGRT